MDVASLQCCQLPALGHVCSNSSALNKPHLGSSYYQRLAMQHDVLCKIFHVIILMNIHSVLHVYFLCHMYSDKIKQCFIKLCCYLSCIDIIAVIPPSHRRRGTTAVLVRHKPQWHRHCRRGSAVTPP